MNVAEVKIWGKTAGAVAWNASTGVAVFEFDPGFRNYNWDLSPLLMSIYSKRRIFEFPALRKKTDGSPDTFKGLPGLLVDSLPDRYGNDLINMWLAKQGRPPDSMNPVEMLCFIGTRGMGALEFEPGTLQDRKRASSIEIESLVEIAKKMVSNRESFATNLQKDEEKAMMEILRIGTSAGGARPKAVIAYNERTGEVKSGQTDSPEGYEHWLIKLDGVSDVQLGKSTGYGRVEMAYYKMAIACGIDMMPSRLYEENGRAHFMTRRFDRENGSVKHHIQTLCGLKHFDFSEVNSYSYEQLFQTMRELKLTYPEAEQMYRRMVFNVLARNCDDHTKNFSFRLKKDGIWELTPAYDICHAYKPEHKWVSQHALSINGKRTDINKEDLLTIGRSIKNKKAEETLLEINNIVHKWKSFADESGVDPKLRDEIAKTLIYL